MTWTLRIRVEAGAGLLGLAKSWPVCLLPDFGAALPIYIAVKGFARCQRVFGPAETD